MRAPRALVASLLAVLVAGCAVNGAAGPGSPTPGSGERVTLTVFAAASLKDAFEDVRTAYAGVAPATTLELSFGASSALRAQIEQGAPADVFASADTTQPAALVASGLTDGPVRPFAANTLVIVVPSDDPAGIHGAADLARPGVRVVAAGPGVPISAYADRAIAALAAEPGYPSDFATRVAANVVSREEDVRAVLAKVELGEADAALVYATDAAASPRVRSIALPTEARVRATYGAVVVKGSRQPAAARAFLDWLTGAEGRSVLERAGFLAP